MDQDNKTSAPYSVQVHAVHGDDDVADISVAMVTLPAFGPYAKIDLNLIIQAPLEKQNLQEEVTEYKVGLPFISYTSLSYIMSFYQFFVNGFYN